MRLSSSLSHISCPKLSTLASALSPALTLIRQKPYYADAKFHASIAWALLPSSSPETEQSQKGAQPGISAALGEGDGTTALPSVFPGSLLSKLNEEFNEQLCKGSFDVEQVRLKIGKDDFAFNLGWNV